MATLEQRLRRAIQNDAEMREDLFQFHRRPPTGVYVGLDDYTARLQFEQDIQHPRYSGPMLNAYITSENPDLPDHGPGAAPAQRRRRPNRGGARTGLAAMLPTEVPKGMAVGTAIAAGCALGYVALTQVPNVDHESVRYVRFLLGTGFVGGAGTMMMSYVWHLLTRD